MHIACRLRDAFDVPIVLLVEYAYDPVKLARRRWYLGLKPLAYPVAGLYWRWLSRNARAIITSYLGDRQHLRYLARYKTPVYYIPWCNQIPEDVAAREVRKESARAIYVGSLSRGKNTQEFAETIPLILGRTPVKEFVVVGSGAGREVVNRMTGLSAGRVKPIESLSRAEALALIQDSYFAYTPVQAGGWGFIGDSWGVKTPLVATHNEYGLRDGVDALVVDRRDQIHWFVNQLYEVPGLYEKLQKGGYERYARQHTATSVGDKLLKVLESVRAGRGGGGRCDP
jgi:glycosyltransferase involved in cell wall biosynthesis